MQSAKKNPALRCQPCGEPMRRARVRVYHRRRKRHVLFEHVPALVCDACGQRVFEAQGVEFMEHILSGPRLPARRKRRAELEIAAT